jgi:hypothetical protein
MNIILNWNSTGAPKVLIFNHATRISNSTFNINDFKKDSKKVIHQAAVFAAHLDQSTWQAGNVLHKYYPDEAETLLRGRFMIVNVSIQTEILLDTPICSNRFLTKYITGMATHQACAQAPIWGLRRWLRSHQRSCHSPK